MTLPPCPRPRSLVVLAAGITAGVVALAGPASAAVAVDGSAGGGDPYFPKAGNGGYQVDDYDLSIRYEPRTARLDATAVLTATARKDLASFSLDLRELTVRSVRVDGQPATFTRTPGELRVVPARPLAAGRSFTVGVSYGGTTGRPTDSGGALYGWVSTPDGAIVANEPEGASTWYPVNDVPTDKATYTFRIDVPAGKVGVANGDLVATSTRNDRTTYTWRMAQPMASYLSTASIGNYALTRSTTSTGLPIVNAVDKDLPPAAQQRAATSLARQGEMIDFFTARFGPYPFSSFGAIVDDDSVDYALETQTRPIYSGAPSQGTVAHELAHQWFGDSVTLSTWDDLWLNEGFATYAEWVWGAEHGGPTLQQRFDDVYGVPASDPFWRQAPGDPGVADLFGAAVYDRGGAALVALRDKIGDADFGTVLHRWAAQHRYGSVTTADLVRLASQVSGKDLAPFFRTWIDATAKPATW